MRSCRNSGPALSFGGSWRLDAARDGGGPVEDLFGQARALHHVRQLLVDDVPASRAQAAVGVHLDALRIAEHVDRVEDPIPDELRRLNEVGVDVEHAQATFG